MQRQWSLLPRSTGSLGLLDYIRVRNIDFYSPRFLYLTELFLHTLVYIKPVHDKHLKLLFIVVFRKPTIP